MVNEDNDSEDHEQIGNPFANLDEETQKKIQDIQILEQNYQQLLMQKQAFNFELNETELALEEIAKAKDDVFKIVANKVVIKSSKEELENELKHKKDLIELRLASINKQESDFSEKLENLRTEIMKRISSK